jgi:hypothetical protein
VQVLPGVRHLRRQHGVEQPRPVGHGQPRRREERQVEGQVVPREPDAAAGGEDGLERRDGRLEGVHPEHPVAPPESRVWPNAEGDGELLPEEQILQHERLRASERSAQRAD